MSFCQHFSVIEGDSDAILPGHLNLCKNRKTLIWKTGKINISKNSIHFPPWLAINKNSPSAFQVEENPTNPSSTGQDDTCSGDASPPGWGVDFLKPHPVSLLILPSSHQESESPLHPVGQAARLPSTCHSLCPSPACRT